MSDSVSVRPGYAYSFLYPRYNYEGLPARSEWRRVLVDNVRDMNDEPLDAETVSLNPSLRRCRWLATGQDLDREVRRSFYVDSMSQLRELTREEYDPLHGAEYVVLTTAGRPAHRASRLADAISLLLSRETGVLCKVVGFRPTMEVPRE